MSEIQSARAIAADVQSGRSSAVNISKVAIERVRALQPKLNALTHFDAEMTLAEAKAVDAQIGAGETLPLAGVPIIIKDTVWVEGRPITQGSRLFADAVPARDARAVYLLKSAGAVILGIGASSEFACKGVTTSLLHGTTHHPMDPDLTPGGSSGGPAVGVAASMAPLALGTDAGGSSRRPPAHVGVVGFKPSQDVIPYGPGYPEPFWNIAVLAPIARDVADTALMFELLSSGPTAAALLPAPEDLKSLRIAFAPTLGLDAKMDTSSISALAMAAERFRAAGFDIADAAPAWPDGAGPGDAMPLQWAGLAALYGTRWQAAPDDFDPDIGTQIEAGLRLSGADVANALEASRKMRETMRAFMDEYDLVLSATTPCAAWPSVQLGPETIGGAPAAPRDHAAFTAQFNHAGLPAISIPCGVSETGLPLGLQIGGGFGRDRTVLGAAAAFEHLLQ
ncbi:amidase [Jiella marina]|uniref:amidase n=1 Tax=Jiella sp. LLJ827 TaxID=2917712 RepID=UPI00210136B1|nr:amidase [Jiella sp. LLJ827]MCQ0986326.1 amidase [Jiella sp. LLJ827]